MPRRYIDADTPLQTWWWVSPHFAQITPVQVVRETARNIVIAEREWVLQGEGRRYERSRHKGSEYFATYSEARKHLVARCLARVEQEQLQLTIAKGMLDEASALPMEAPDVAH